MPDTKNAVALRSFTHADDSFAKDQVIRDMDAGQFDDWSVEGVDLVREATAEDLKAAKADAKAKPAETPAAA